MKARYRYYLIILGCLFLLALGIGFWYYIKWSPMWTPASQIALYPVEHKDTDTLKVVMIGDSWAGMHSLYVPDSIVSSEWSSRMSVPVVFDSKGSGGAVSREVYRYMFMESGLLEDKCTQDLIQSGPNYCIVTVGINDANQCLGPAFYCANYLLIVRGLLACGIRPVVVEIPDVNLEYVYGKKPLKDKLCDMYRSFLTNSKMYDVEEYRKAWRERLKSEQLMDSVLYICKDLWNPEGCKAKDIYLEDQIHLNAKGYYLLDSCVIDEILRDMNDHVI